MRGGENPKKSGAFWPWAKTEQQMPPIFCKITFRGKGGKEVESIN